MCPPALTLTLRHTCTHVCLMKSQGRAGPQRAIESESPQSHRAGPPAARTPLSQEARGNTKALTEEVRRPGAAATGAPALKVSPTAWCPPGSCQEEGGTSEHSSALSASGGDRAGFKTRQAE